MHFIVSQSETNKGQTKALGDEILAETVQPTRGGTPEELEKYILQET